MRKYIDLSDFNSLMQLLEMLRRVDMLEPASFIVTWEKRPRLTINRLGNFEFENPQEVYGVVITFWDGVGNVVCNRRFVLAERFDEDEDV
jgi:hypothetical protein